VIRQIDSSTNDAAQRTAAAPGAAAATTPAKKAFATVLARQSATATAAGSTGSNYSPIDSPTGEVWTPVNGDSNAAKIAEGPRAGLYINISHGERRGQTYSVEDRNGKTVHVYGSGSGSGSSQTVVDAAADKGTQKSSLQPPKGEQWAPVPGHHNYVQIVAGPRNGQFVNVSGGIRDGMAFQIVKQGDNTYHVYGSGKDRLTVDVSSPKRTTEGGGTGGVTGPGSTHVIGQIDAPKGEVWTPVPGERAARITAGPRKGLYINLNSHGRHRGETFTIEHRDGKEIHVYRDGIREVSEAVDGASRKTHAHPASGETWSPIQAEQGYAKIVSGTRKGMYIDLSGGRRDGMAFRIQTQAGGVYHRYENGHRVKVGSAPATGTTGTTDGAVSTPTNGPAKIGQVNAPAGEVWTPVSGQNAARITEGPRAGQFINLNPDGVHRGETYTVEQRDGKTVHVYGGGIRVVDAAQDGATSKSRAQPAGGEQWAPVAGEQGYAQIVGGSRNGLFIDISNGPRNGTTFQIVKHSGGTYHLYGSGASAQLVPAAA
jgi:hypothetical protein